MSNTFEAHAKFKVHRAARTRPGIRPLGSGAKAGAEQARRQHPGSRELPAAAAARDANLSARVPEIGGPEGPEPTRYGDWERKGICCDF